MEELFKRIEEIDLKIKFGLQPEHIKIIESKFIGYPSFKYNTTIWNDIGKEIGWCPLTAALHYFRHLRHDEEDVKYKSRDEIIYIVCERYDVTLDQLQEQSRVRKFSDVRHIIFYLLHRKKGMTQQSVANIFNRKTHGVVISGCKVVDGFIATLPEYKKNMEELILLIQ